jgi:hypothetical protein
MIALTSLSAFQPALRATTAAALALAVAQQLELLPLGK